MTQRINLEAFTGRWSTSGRVLATPTTSALEIKGFDTYEWLAGGFFLVHKVDVMLGTDHEESLEIIGYDETTDVYPMHFFDNHGNSGLMEGKLVGDVWTFLSRTMRFTGRFSKAGNKLSGKWEQSADGANWIAWMEINLSKIEM